MEYLHITRTLHARCQEVNMLHKLLIPSLFLKHIVYGMMVCAPSESSKASGYKCICSLNCFEGFYKGKVMYL